MEVGWRLCKPILASFSPEISNSILFLAMSSTQNCLFNPQRMDPVECRLAEFRSGGIPCQATLNRVASVPSLGFRLEVAQSCHASSCLCIPKAPNIERESLTWTPKVCKIIVFKAFIMGFGLFCLHTFGV